MSSVSENPDDKHTVTSFKIGLAPKLKQGKSGVAPTLHPPNLTVGVIGPHGFDESKLFGGEFNPESTPFSLVPASVKSGKIEGVTVVYVKRNAINDNIRANVWGLLKRGCHIILSVTDVTSLKKSLKRGTIVLPEDLCDLTCKQSSTFYDATEGGPPGTCRIPMTNPFGVDLRRVVISAAKSAHQSIHSGGLIGSVDGQRAMSKAENDFYKSRKITIMDASTVPEAVLSTEVGMMYAVLGVVTQFGPRHQKGVLVTAEVTQAAVRESSANVCALLRSTITKIRERDWTGAIQHYKGIARASIVAPTGMEGNAQIYAHLK